MRTTTWRTVLRAFGLAVSATAIAAVAVVGAATSADAATREPDGTWIAWKGTSSGVEFTVTLTCATVGSCTVDTSSPRLSGSTRWTVSDISGDTFRGTFAAYGDLCAPGDSAASTGGRFRLVAGAASGELFVDVDNREVPCGNGSVQYLDSSGKGRFVGGSTCVITGVSCPPEPTPTPTPTPEPVPTPSAAVAPVAAPTVAPLAATPDRGLLSGTGLRLASGSPAAPSVLWQLSTAAQSVPNAAQLALAAAVTVVLVLLVSFPTALLNSAVEAAPERFAALTARFRRRRPAAGETEKPADAGAEPAQASAPAAEGPPASDRPFARHWWLAAAGVVVAGLVSAFVDPGFGLNPGSIRVLLGILVGFVVEVVIGWSVAVWVSRRLDGAATVSYRFAPFSLVIVALAVLFTRLTGFEPGVIFGLVAGVVIGLTSAASVRGKAALALAGYGLAVGLVGWVLYSALGPVLAAHPTFWGGLAIDTMSSLAMAGVASVPLVLLPVRGLAGHDVFTWNRWVWTAVYVAGLLVFFFVLMPMPYSWEQISLSLGTWIAIYAVYALVAVGGWLAVARPWRKDGEPGDDADAGGPASGIEAPVSGPASAAAPGIPAVGTATLEG